VKWYIIAGAEIIILTAAAIAARECGGITARRLLKCYIAAHVVIVAAVLPFLAGCIAGLLSWARRGG